MNQNENCSIIHRLLAEKLWLVNYKPQDQDFVFLFCLLNKVLLFKVLKLYFGQS